MAAFATPHGRSLRIVSKTWAQDRGDLFDFEADPLAGSSDIHHQAFTVSESMACVRSGANVHLLPREQVPSSSDSEFLVSFVRQGASLWIEQAPDAAAGSLRPSLVVKDLPGGCLQLRGGETIRLGCAKVRVRQVVASGGPPLRPRLRPDGEGPPCWANPEPPEVLAEKPCRICMLDGPNEGDPLVAPCSCRGSVEYVHLGCLREWIRVRRNLPSGGEPCSSLVYQPLKCDLCKGSYAASVRFGSETAPLTEVPCVQPPFVVLDVRGRHSGSGGRQVHVLSLAGGKLLRLGRAHNCDLRITDASISRWHASLRVHEGRVLLEDHESKFGTLVEVQRPIAVETSGPVSVQVGRTVLEFSPALQDAAGPAEAPASPGEPGARDDDEPALGA